MDRAEIYFKCREDPVFGEINIAIDCYSGGSAQITMSDRNTGPPGRRIAYLSRDDMAELAVWLQEQLAKEGQ